MVLMTLALVTAETRLMPFFLAYSKARRTMRSAPWRGDDLEVHSQVIGDIEARAAQNVLAFGVLPVEDPVDALLRHLDRPDVGEEVQLAAHGDVGALQVGPFVAFFGCGEGPFQDDVALLQGRQSLFRQGFHDFDPLLDGQAGDVLQLDLPSWISVARTYSRTLTASLVM